jgi:hypothetical protein
MKNKYPIPNIQRLFLPLRYFVWVSVILFMACPEDRVLTTIDEGKLLESLSKAVGKLGL